jgi:hypothetical protein
VKTLGEQQRKFTRLVARLIDRIYAEGHEATFGEAWRTPEQAALNAKKGTGISNSLHMDRLAIDLNLFKDGKYLADTESHRRFGEWWERLDPDCRWGGRFKDGNHYSLTWGGRA